MALLLPLSLAGKMSVSNLFHYFINHSKAFGFQVSTLPDNIVLNAANKNTDQSLSYIKTGIGATGLATL